MQRVGCLPRLPYYFGANVFNPSDMKSVVSMIAQRMKVAGVDYTTISAYDAWKHYVESIRASWVAGGIIVPDDFNKAIQVESEAGKVFQKEWTFACLLEGVVRTEPLGAGIIHPHDRN